MASTIASTSHPRSIFGLNHFSRHESCARHSLSVLVLLATCSYPFGHAVGMEIGQCVANPSTLTNFEIDLPASIPNLSNARLILAEDFDAQDDLFLPRSGIQCKRPGDADCSFVPDGWTHMYNFERFHPVEQQDASLHASMEISDFQDSNGAGKSLTIWDESWGGSSRWGSDAILARQFDEEVKDIYAEFKIKFQPNYRWHGIESNNGLNQAKLFRFSHFDGGEDHPFRFFGDGFSAPIMFIDLVVSGKYNTASLRTALRCDPQAANYKCGDYNESESYSLDTSFAGSIGDGGWHKIGVRAKMNSAPGVADGIVSIWFNDQLIEHKNDVPFLGTGADASIGWNMGMVGGNLHNYPEAESEQFEQWHSFDEVVFYRLD